MTKYNVDKLAEIMAALRNPKSGCPWDLKQTYQTIIPYTLEEAYEVADAIEQADFAELQLELGDLLFQVIFYCQLAKEDGHFEFSDVVDSICEKLVRRHPHVFNRSDLLTDNALTEQEIKDNWENEKQIERNQKSKNLILDDVPNALPALLRSYKIQKRCAKIGFDWPDVTGALDKVEEEIAELKHELNLSAQTTSTDNTQEGVLNTIDQDNVAAEMGDLMFAMVNVVRKLGLNPEETLRQANAKFTRRFNEVEQLAQGDKPLADMTLAEMELLWDRVKANEVNTA